MKLIYLVITLTFLFSGCNNDGTINQEDIGSTPISNSDGINRSRIYVVNCDNTNSVNSTNDCGNADIPDYYTCIKSNDTLVKETDNTTVEIVHNSNGTKKVCVKSGGAYLLR